MDELNETRKTLDKIKILPKLRNKFAFHLGCIEDYCKGLKEMTTNGYEFILIKSDESYQRGSFNLSWDALSKGIGIDEEDYIDALDIIREMKSSLPNQLLNVFDEVRETAGIQVIDDRKEPEEKDKLT